MYQRWLAGSGGAAGEAGGEFFPGGDAISSSSRNRGVCSPPDCALPMRAARSPSMWPQGQPEGYTLGDTSAPPDFAIETSGLTKTYPASKRQPAKQALKGIDLVVP